MTPKPVKIGLAVVLLGVGFGAIVAVDRLGWINGSAAGNDTQSAAARACPHGMPDAKCPFCDESLIDCKDMVRDCDHSVSPQNR